MRALTGEEREYGSQDLWDVITRFVRSKLSPALGTAVDIRTGENVVGEKVTVSSGLAGLVTPLIVEDVYEAILAQGVPKGTEELNIKAFLEGRKHQ